MGYLGFKCYREISCYGENKLRPKNFFLNLSKKCFFWVIVLSYVSVEQLGRWAWYRRIPSSTPLWGLRWWKLLITADSARLLCRCFARKTGPSLITELNYEQTRNRDFENKFVIGHQVIVMLKLLLLSKMQSVIWLWPVR